ncbi:MAG TPA: ribbon-helix-helix protein, CopG family [Ruminiclostridium sp.]|nr:ribbon-helix-helix protein, CopG family [Ruminiclostridium sp.]
MSQYKKIMVSIPDNLLEEIDNMATVENTNRSELVREAMKLYLKERRKTRLREEMRLGYEEMAEINLKLAEVCLAADNEQQRKYEERLGEMEETW